MDNPNTISDKQIYIRCDGNKEIATGHLMRCLSIATACVDKGAQVTFLVADKESEQLLSDRMSAAMAEQIRIMNLQTDYRNTEEELPLLCQILMSYPCHCLLIDSYFVNPGYLETLSRLTKVAYIDDIYAFPYPVHTVINYAPMADPANVCYQLAAEKLLGISYAPVRNMFQGKSCPIRPQVKKILLTAGGIHDGKCYLPILENLFAFYGSLAISLSDGESAEASETAPEIHLLLGAGDNTAPEVRDYLEQHPDLITHGYIQDMASFLCDFDLVFAAAGTTLYELCALGIPACSFISADNQIPSAMDFEAAGLIPCLGNTVPIPIPESEESIPVNPENIETHIKQFLSLAQDVTLRQNAASFMRKSLDQKGASRIGDALLA